MNSTVLWIVTLLAAYLLGSVPFGYLLVRFARNEDIRATGSGNIGATNVARSGAKGLAIATLLLDALKGFAAVALARTLVLHYSSYPSGYDLVAMAALLAVVGHIFPVWLGFRGGKGVATALGVFFALTPFTAVSLLLIFGVVVGLTRIVSLASLVAAACYPFLAVGHDLLSSAGKHRLLVDLVYVAIPLLVIAKHSSNIARLRAGTESKFGSKRAEGTTA